MRLGGPVSGYRNPEEWVKLHLARGYGAAYCPVTSSDDEATIDAYLEAARAHGIIIAEVGAWSNPMSPDLDERKRAFDNCVGQLALAQRVGARCCVNITGSRGRVWDGPHPDNLTVETYQMIVETTRAIIDAVKPTDTFYTLETMPCMYPNDARSYERLLRDIDRPAFAVHADMCNTVSGYDKVYSTGDATREFFGLLTGKIRSVHVKDIAVRARMTMCIEEVLSGEGVFDHDALLKECAKEESDLPLMLEHLESDALYEKARAYIQERCALLGLEFITGY